MIPLNDCSDAADSVDTYVGALRGIFTQLREAGSEVAFMTPNTMNFYVDRELDDPDIITVAERKMALQVGGIFDRHIEAARALCGEMGVALCDCYAIWQSMKESGVDVTALLSNRINHPTRELHGLFAAELLRLMLAGEG